MATQQSTVSDIRLQAAGIAPGITVDDLQKSLRFYTEGLGFEVERQGEHDGKVTFYMLKAGNAHLGIGQDDWAKGRDRAKGQGLRFWMQTNQDLHALAGKMKAAGYPLDEEVKPLPWGPLGFAFTDPDGFKFTISNPGEP